jgi:hypothetical protein
LNFATLAFVFDPASFRVRAIKILLSLSITASFAATKEVSSIFFSVIIRPVVSKLSKRMPVAPYADESGLAVPMASRVPLPVYFKVV